MSADDLREKLAADELADEHDRLDQHCACSIHVAHRALRQQLSESIALGYKTMAIVDVVRRRYKAACRLAVAIAGTSPGSPRHIHALDIQDEMQRVLVEMGDALAPGAGSDPAPGGTTPA